MGGLQEEQSSCIHWQRVHKPAIPDISTTEEVHFQRLLNRITHSTPDTIPLTGTHSSVGKLDTLAESASVKLNSHAILLQQKQHSKIKHWCLFSKLADQMGAYNHGVLIFMDANTVVSCKYTPLAHKPPLHF